MDQNILNSLKIDVDTDQALAVQLANQLTWLIASGQIVAGNKLPPVRELASQLGINLHTVRAAYRKLEENRLITMRQGTGSVVQNFNAIQMAEKATSLLTHTIGVIVPDSANPFYPAVIKGMIQVAKEKHILLIICDTRESHSLGKEYLDMLVAKRVDGLIIAPYGLRLEGCNTDDDLRQNNCPVPIVYMDRPEEPGYGVLLDAEGAGYRATQHLVGHGHRRIAMITGNIQVPTLNEAFLGYQRALAANGITYDPSVIFQADFFTYSAGYEAAQIFLNHPNPPKAIFASGDMYAIGAIRAIRDRGLRVPEDVAVVGYNNIDVSAYTEPPLTTVNTPMHEMGVVAMTLLDQMIKGELIEKERIVMPTELIIRQSCGCKT
jgi:DNA-binding LacI/PurR family transcriptional regulator